MGKSFSHPETDCRSQAKNFQKRINLDGHIDMVTQKHKTRVYYSSVVPRARQHIDLNKDTALLHFSKNKAYQNTVTQNSYAEVLRFGRTIPVTVKPSTAQLEKQKCSNCLSTLVQSKLPEAPVHLVNATESFTKIYKQEYQKPLMLHNRFDVLKIIDTSNVVYDMHCISEQNTEGCDRNFVSKLAMGVDAQLGDLLCPALDGKSKTFLVGKKRKWVFHWGSY